MCVHMCVFVLPRMSAQVLVCCWSYTPNPNATLCAQVPPNTPPPPLSPLPLPPHEY